MPNFIEVQTKLQEITKKKVTYSDIGNALNVTRANISKRSISGSSLTSEEIKKIEQFYNVNLSVDNGSDPSDNCLNLPVLGEVTASMGAGIEVYNESRTGIYKISAKVLKDIGANPKESDIIFCSGDSMEPTIQGGSALIVDKSRTDVIDGKIYCIQFNGVLMAKRLQLLPPKKLRVISDNFNKYPAWDIDFSKDIDFDFKVIGEVMRWMTNAR